jgi:hypothetical protein
MINIASNPYLLAIGMILFSYILLWLTKLVFTVKMEKFFGDYDLFMDIHQDILFDIKNTFEMEKIILAYPTQTVKVLPTEVLIRSDNNTQGDSRGSEDSIVS